MIEFQDETHLFTDLDMAALASVTATPTITTVPVILPVSTQSLLDAGFVWDTVERRWERASDFRPGHRLNPRPMGDGTPPPPMVLDPIREEDDDEE